VLNAIYCILGHPKSTIGWDPNHVAPQSCKSGRLGLKFVKMFQADSGLHTKLFYNIKSNDFFLSWRRFVVITAVISVSKVIDFSSANSNCKHNCVLLFSARISQSHTLFEKTTTVRKLTRGGGASKGSIISRAFSRVEIRVLFFAMWKSVIPDSVLREQSGLTLRRFLQKCIFSQVYKLTAVLASALGAYVAFVPVLFDPQILYGLSIILSVVFFVIYKLMKCGYIQMNAGIITANLQKCFLIAAADDAKRKD